MNCVSLKNISICKVHEFGLLRNYTLGDIPSTLRKEFQEKKKCCFFSDGNTFSIESIKIQYQSLRPDEDLSSESLIWFVSLFVRKMCHEAVLNGHLKCFMYTVDHGFTRMCLMLENEKSIDVRLLKLNVHHPLKQFSDMYHTWKEAIQRGHIDILLYGAKFGKKFSTHDFDIAAENGHLNILICPELTNGVNLDYSFIVKSAAKGGHVHILEYCFEHHRDQLSNHQIQSPVKRAVANAMWKKHSKVVKFLFTNAKEHFSESVWKKIASFPESAEFIELGLDNGFEMTNKVWKRAARAGNVGVIMVAIDRNIELDKSVWDKASEFGHLDLLLIAIEKKIKLDKDVWVNAAANGYLNILTCQKLTNGITMDYEFIFTSAAENGFTDILEYCFEQWKDEITPFIRKAVERAVRHCETNSLIFLFPHAKEHFSEPLWMKIASFYRIEKLVELAIDSGVVFPDDFWVKALEKGKNPNLLGLRHANMT